MVFPPSYGNGLDGWSRTCCSRRCLFRLATCNIWGTTKCKALHVSKKKSPSVYLPYRLSNDNLECAFLITDLGISISCDLQWKYHIGKMIAGANRKLGLIKRACRFITNRHTRKILLCSLVRPQLEYCSSLWSPSVYNQSNRECSKTCNEIHSKLSIT